MEAFHGPDWYTNDRYTGPTTFDHPQEWDAYPGHYRSYNPWLSNFRIVLRKGALALVDPSGDGEPLVPLACLVDPYMSITFEWEESAQHRLHVEKAVTSLLIAIELRMTACM